MIKIWSQQTAPRFHCYFLDQHGYAVSVHDFTARSKDDAVALAHTLTSECDDSRCHAYELWAGARLVEAGVTGS